METSEKGVILDSSVWVSFLHDVDSQHAHAIETFEEVGDSITVPEYVLVEVATILKRKEKVNDAKKFVHRVLNEKPESFLPAESLVRETAAVFRERDDTLSFTDTALVVLSKDYRVITFDRALQIAIEGMNT